jgi:hypothetical protein
VDLGASEEPSEPTLRTEAAIDAVAEEPASV